MIRPVESIPEPTPKPLSQRDLVRRDVEDALKNGISNFKFIGNEYRYENLINNARDALKAWFSCDIYYPADRKAKARLKKKFTDSFWTPLPHEYFKKAVSLYKRKNEDRVHVYCSLNIDMINDMENIIYKDTIKRHNNK